MSQQINLYNPLFLRREKHFSVVTIVWSLLAVAIFLAGYCGYATYAVRATENRAKYYERQVLYKRSEMVDTVARYSPEGRNKQLEADVKNLESQLAGPAGDLAFAEQPRAGHRDRLRRLSRSIFQAFGRRGLADRIFNRRLRRRADDSRPRRTA